MSKMSLVRPCEGMSLFADYLKSRTAAIAAVAPRHIDPNRVIRIVLGCVSKTPKLQECTSFSILRSVLQAVELGLEPGSALGQAYLVPFDKECTLIIGYRGLLDLMRRTGSVASVSAHAVYEGDELEIMFGLEEKLVHIPRGEPDPEKLIGAYAVVRFRDGSHQMDYMTRKQIDAIRARSRAGNYGPWVTDYAEMARKTVLRNVAKWCPMSVELSKAIAVDVAADTGDMSAVHEFESLDASANPDVLSDTVTIPPVQTASRIRSRVKAMASRSHAGEASETVSQDGRAPDPDLFADCRGEASDAS